MSPTDWIAHYASAHRNTMLQLGPPKPWRRRPAEPLSRSIIDSAFTRLRQTIEAKDVSTEQLRSAALEALERAKEEIEHDPLCLWLSEQLERLQREEE